MDQPAAASYCRWCGTALLQPAAFCPSCGRGIGDPSTAPAPAGGSSEVTITADQVALVATVAGFLLGLAIGAGLLGSLALGIVLGAGGAFLGFAFGRRSPAGPPEPPVDAALRELRTRLGPAGVESAAPIAGFIGGFLVVRVLFDLGVPQLVTDVAWGLPLIGWVLSVVASLPVVGFFLGILTTWLVLALLAGVAAAVLADTLLHRGPGEPLERAVTASVDRLGSRLRTSGAALAPPADHGAFATAGAHTTAMTTSGATTGVSEPAPSMATPRAPSGSAPREEHMETTGAVATAAPAGTIQAAVRIEQSIRSRTDSDRPFMNWWLATFIVSPITLGLAGLYFYFKMMSRVDDYSRRKLAYYDGVIEYTQRRAEAAGNDAVAPLVRDLRNDLTVASNSSLKPIGAGLSLLLYIVTFGIWGLVILWKVNRAWDDRQRFEAAFDDRLSQAWLQLGLLRHPIVFRVDEGKRRNYWIWLVLSVVTLGIAGIVWHYKLWTDPDRMYPEVHAVEDSVLQITRTA